MNKYEKFLKDYPGVVFWAVVLLGLISVYLYNTRLQKVYNFRVIDGDTVTVFLEKNSLNKVETVRFVDMDCYELKRTKKARQQAKNAGITAEEVVKIGKESTQILTDLLNSHKDEIYFKAEYPHRYDWRRILGTLYINDLSVTDYMIAEGKCLKYQRRPYD
jgi:endonuclease YncB( thermonuclease family)